MLPRGKRTVRFNALSAVVATPSLPECRGDRYNSADANTQPNQMPRTRFQAGAGAGGGAQPSYDGVLTSAGTTPEYADPDELHGGGALHRGSSSAASSAAVVDVGGYVDGLAAARSVYLLRRIPLLAGARPPTLAAHEGSTSCTAQGRVSASAHPCNRQTHLRSTRPPRHCFGTG